MTMTWTARELIEWAASQIGVKEDPPNSNRVKYWDFYKKQCGMNLQGNPWCAAFTAEGYTRAGIWSFTKDEGRFRYCPSIVNWAKENGWWRDRKEKPKAGWLILFANKGTACHVGFVEKRIDASKVQTIEGNPSSTSNDNGGAVMRRTRTYGTVGSSWYILGFVAPPEYDGGSSANSGTSSASKDVSAIADEVIDGKWGNDPDRSAKLKAAGYDPDEVQAAVNKKLGASSSSQKPVTKPSQSSTADSGLRTGRYEITSNSGLWVRQGPGKNYAKKSYSQLTSNAKSHAASNGCLLKGTRMDVSEISTEGSVRVWGKIPSGWVCLKENGSMLAKRV